MSTDQADRIGTALKKLAEFEQLKLDDLLEERKETEELERKFDADSVIHDAELKAIKLRATARREAHREATSSIAEASKETNAAIAENYRRQDELFERLAALADKLVAS